MAAVNANVAKLANSAHQDAAHASSGTSSEKKQTSTDDAAAKEAKELIGSQLKKELSHIITKIVNKARAWPVLYFRHRCVCVCS